MQNIYIKKYIEKKIGVTWRMWVLSLDTVAQQKARFFCKEKKVVIKAPKIKPVCKKRKNVPFSLL